MQYQFDINSMSHQKNNVTKDRASREGGERKKREKKRGQKGREESWARNKPPENQCCRAVEPRDVRAIGFASSQLELAC